MHASLNPSTLLTVAVTTLLLPTLSTAQSGVSTDLGNPNSTIVNTASAGASASQILSSGSSEISQVQSSLSAALSSVSSSIDTATATGMGSVNATSASEVSASLTASASSRVSELSSSAASAASVASTGGTPNVAGQWPGRPAVTGVAAAGLVFVGGLAALL